MVRSSLNYRAAIGGDTAAMRPGGEVDIRRMTESEIREVSDLLQRCYAWLGEREGLSSLQTEYLQSERGSETTVRRESARETYLVADDGACLAGMVAISGEVITKLYVLPANHRTGVGRALCRAAASAIWAAGHTRACLGAFPTAVPFYEAMGFRPIGVRESAGALAGLRVTLMEKSLGGDPPDSGR
jgi:GNAT superfamily N-acetyltransferase